MKMQGHQRELEECVQMTDKIKNWVRVPRDWNHEVPCTKLVCLAKSEVHVHHVS